MGLDASVGEYETPDYISERLGSYSGYAAWREAIAKAKGFDLNEMIGFGGNTPWEGKPFPLVLKHSDCDGEYSVEQIPALLKELHDIRRLNVDDYEQSKKFIRLCKAALKQNKPIVFG